MKVYIALLHYPVYNKKKKVVTTCVATFDLHDIARAAATFGVKKYYVVNPLPTQRSFAERVLTYWSKAEGKKSNWTRAEALKLIELQPDFKSVVLRIKKREKKTPLIVATSAKIKRGITPEELKNKVEASKQPVLLVFGTGWGLTKELLLECDYVLESIIGRGRYNHLSVRSAAAIILDRLLGRDK